MPENKPEVPVEQRSCIKCKWTNEKVRDKDSHCHHCISNDSIMFNMFEIDEDCKNLSDKDRW